MATKANVRGSHFITHLAQFPSGLWPSGKGRHNLAVPPSLIPELNIRSVAPPSLRIRGGHNAGAPGCEAGPGPAHMYKSGLPMMFDAVGATVAVEQLPGLWSEVDENPGLCAYWALFAGERLEHIARKDRFAGVDQEGGLS